MTMQEVHGSLNDSAHTRFNHVNEMVSLGDTAISLHILQPTRGGGDEERFWEVKTQSAKICLNFNFQGMGVGSSGKSKPKVP